ncbi:MAG: HEAT repeat domain-containing protein [Sandaracinaceae bacterium]|nr:HEAT repeat domain-containing protein [Sandaracinaceae bacterium]
MSEARTQLDRILSLSREIHALEASFLQAAPPSELAEILHEAAQKAFTEALGAIDLSEIAFLCAQLEDPLAFRTLFELLSHPDEQVQESASSHLEEIFAVAFDKTEKVVQELLQENRLPAEALEELPYLLLEAASDFDVLPLLLELLKSPHPSVVACAIDVLVEIGDRRALPHLKHLLSDEREVNVQDDQDSGAIKLGDLAELALQSIEGPTSRSKPAPHHPSHRQKNRPHSNGAKESKPSKKKHN